MRLMTSLHIILAFATFASLHSENSDVFLSGVKVKKCGKDFCFGSDAFEIFKKRGIIHKPIEVRSAPIPCEVLDCPHIPDLGAQISNYPECTTAVVDVMKNISGYKLFPPIVSGTTFGNYYTYYGLFLDQPYGSVSIDSFQSLNQRCNDGYRGDLMEGLMRLAEFHTVNEFRHLYYNVMENYEELKTAPFVEPYLLLLKYVDPGDGNVSFENWKFGSGNSACFVPWSENQPDQVGDKGAAIDLRGHYDKFELLDTGPNKKSPVLCEYRCKF